METMKLRLIAMGGIPSLLSFIPLGVRDLGTSGSGLLGVGIILLVPGVLWNQQLVHIRVRTGVSDNSADDVPCLLRGTRRS